MTQHGKIDLNTASKGELGRISDIGDECAERIVEEREKRGGFKSIDELESIGGFGQEAIKNLKDQARV